MKVLTLFGTRPEIIRLSRVIPVLDRFCTHLMVHTGQNYDSSLSDIFFQELGVRAPDHYLGIQAETFAGQVAQILTRTGEILAREQPDRLLILGDTNSGLAAIVAARMGVPVYHMEAGNRCYDNRVPEEINRRVIDHSSAVLMPYTERSKDNLVREGIPRQRIFVTGNPIYEVLTHFHDRIEASDVLTRLNLLPHEFFLVTLHRAENVDQPDRLETLFLGLDAIAEKYQQPLIVSLHPRTRDKLERFGLGSRSGQVRLMQPLGFFDFVRLEQAARCVLTDSGTVQEECAILRVPNVTLRDVTERPETIEVGSNVLSGADTQSILMGVDLALSSERSWDPPPEYLQPGVSTTVAKIVLGYHHDSLLNAH